MSEKTVARGDASSLTSGPSDPTQPTVGWIGMGAIGLPMAARAVAAGWRVWGYDASLAQRQAAGAAGIDVAKDIEEVVAHAEGLVVCVVRTLVQVESTLLGDRGVLHGGEPPVVVVMSSVGAVGLSDLEVRVREVGGRILDAPILGNPHAASAGTLTIVVSGSPDDVVAARPVFDTFASAVVVLGDEVGLAQTVKMVSQLRQIVGMLATIEGLELAVRRGVDERTVLDVLGETEPSWATDNWTYVNALWAGRNPTTSLGVFAKDLAAALSDAQAAELDIALTREAYRLIEARMEGTDENR